MLMVLVVLYSIVFFTRRNRNRGASLPAAAIDWLRTKRWVSEVDNNAKIPEEDSNVPVNNESVGNGSAHPYNTRRRARGSRNEEVSSSG